MSGRISERKIKRMSVTFSDGIREYHGTTSDLSHTGLFIRSRKVFRPGTALKVVIELDEQQKIAFTGVVTRFIKVGTVEFRNGIGVKLTSIPQEYKDLVEKLIEK
jgi:Tfp pilus assembly protein PilZ